MKRRGKAGICAAALIILLAGGVIYVKKFGVPGARHSVTLTWVASTSKVDGYRVYRSDSSDGPFIFIGLVPASETSYTDYQVKAGMTYHYIVRSVDAEGLQSVNSNEAITKVPVL